MADEIPIQTGGDYLRAADAISAFLEGDPEVGTRCSRRYLDELALIDSEYDTALVVSAAISLMVAVCGTQGITDDEIITLVNSTAQEMAYDPMGRDGVLWGSVHRGEEPAWLEQ